MGIEDESRDQRLEDVADVLSMFSIITIMGTSALIGNSIY